MYVAINKGKFQGELAQVLNTNIDGDKRCIIVQPLGTNKGIVLEREEATPLSILSIGKLIQKENYRSRVTSAISRNDLRLMSNLSVKDVDIIVPNKVVVVTFLDDTKTKAVCAESDVFSLETAISICITKKILGGTKAYNKLIKHGMRVYQDRVNKEATEEKERKRIEKKRIKRLAQKKRRVEKKKEEQIEIQKEAYLRAMDEIKKSTGIVGKEREK